MDCLEATTVTLFVDKRLSPARASDVERHVDGCSPCRRLLAELARDGGEPGDRIDRYVLLRVVGSGGMGTVYAAYDPTLDRKLAVKLLRTPDADGRVRLIGEARTMAKVTSPHVVAVYDAGVVGDEVYVSMELVGGGTLRDWMRERRSWREVARVFAQAGRGLAAAHAGGVVHRDFKPENVLIDGDRVCVADFGLATPILPPARSTPTGDVDHPLTLSGAVVGTPAYMAPEQIAGDKADARSDQFSFCVALYEALYGARPFAGTTLDEIADAIGAGRIRSATGNVPARLRAIVVRGLAADPAQRHPSMPALVAALDKRPRRVAVIAGGVAIAAIAAVAGARVVAASPDPCEAAGVQAAGYDPAAIRRGLGDGADRVIASFEAWRADAGSLRAATCKASRVDGTESEQLADLRAECIDDSARRVAALASEFAKPSTALAESAAAAVEHAVELAPCRGRRAMLEPGRPPDEPDRRASYEALRTRLAVARVAADAGRYGDAVAAGTAIATEAARDGFRAIEAEAWGMVGTAQADSAHPLAARETVRRALVAAEAAGDESGRALNYLQLASIERTLDRDAEATQLVAQARAIVDHINDDTLRPALLTADATLASDANDFEKALAAMQQALEALHGVEDLKMVTVLQSIGIELTLLARLDEADRVLSRALAIGERVAGPRAPVLIPVLTALGAERFAAGKQTDGLALVQRAFAIAETAPGRGNAQIPLTLDPLAYILASMHRTDEAIAIVDRALPGVAHAYGERSNEYVSVLETRARILGELGRLDEAAEAATKAVALARAAERSAATDGQTSRRAADSTGQALLALGAIHQQRGDATSAIAAFAEALKLPGRDAFDAETGLGHSYVLAKRYADAIPHLEHAIAIRTTGDAAKLDQVEVSGVKVTLARALLALGRDRDKAVTLLREARAVFEASDHAQAELEEAAPLFAKYGVK